MIDMDCAVSNFKSAMTDWLWLPSNKMFMLCTQHILDVDTEQIYSSLKYRVFQFDASAMGPEFQQHAPSGQHANRACDNRLLISWDITYGNTEPMPYIMNAQFFTSIEQDG